MLFGDGTLTDMQNLPIFKSVQLHLNEENVLPIYDHNTPFPFLTSTTMIG
jgi:hypothetical protein